MTDPCASLREEVTAIEGPLAAVRELYARGDAERKAALAPELERMTTELGQAKARLARCEREHPASRRASGHRPAAWRGRWLVVVGVVVLLLTAALTAWDVWTGDTTERRRGALARGLPLTVVRDDHTFWYWNAVAGRAAMGGLLGVACILIGYATRPKRPAS